MDVEGKFEASSNSFLLLEPGPFLGDLQEKSVPGDLSSQLYLLFYFRDVQCKNREMKMRNTYALSAEKRQMEMPPRRLSDQCVMRIFRLTPSWGAFGAWTPPPVYR